MDWSKVADELEAQSEEMFEAAKLRARSGFDRDPAFDAGHVILFALVQGIRAGLPEATS